MSSEYPLKITTEQAREMPMVDLAFELLKSANTPFYYRDLIMEIAKIRGLSQEEINQVIAQVYTEINIDGRFACVGSNMWGLKRWYPVERSEDYQNPTVEDAFAHRGFADALGPRWNGVPMHGWAVQFEPSGGGRQQRNCQCSCDRLPPPAATGRQHQAGEEQQIQSSEVAVRERTAVTIKDRRQAGSHDQHGGQVDQRRPPEQVQGITR